MGIYIMKHISCNCNFNNLFAKPCFNNYSSNEENQTTLNIPIRSSTAPNNIIVDHPNNRSSATTPTNIIDDQNNNRIADIDDQNNNQIADRPNVNNQIVYKSI